MRHHNSLQNIKGDRRYFIISATFKQIIWISPVWIYKKGASIHTQYTPLSGEKKNNLGTPALKWPYSTNKILNAIEGGLLWDFFLIPTKLTRL